MGQRLGGVAGLINSALLDNCSNYCNVLSSTSHSGGLVGWGNGEILNSKNKGNISISSSAEAYASGGGIIGFANSNLKIFNCYNYGNVKNEGLRVYSGAGGILGSTCNYAVELNNCYNKGLIEGTYSFGGIVGGYWYDNWISSVKNCYYLEGSCNYRDWRRYGR